MAIQQDLKRMWHFSWISSSISEWCTLYLNFHDDFTLKWSFASTKVRWNELLLKITYQRTICMCFSWPLSDFCMTHLVLKCLLTSVNYGYWSNRPIVDFFCFAHCTSIVVHQYEINVFVGLATHTWWILQYNAPLHILMFFHQCELYVLLLLPHSYEVLHDIFSI